LKSKAPNKHNVIKKDSDLWIKVQFQVLPVLPAHALRSKPQRILSLIRPIPLPRRKKIPFDLLWIILLKD
jgi:hypothetical protein